MERIKLVWILILTLTVLPACLGQEFFFDDEIQHNATCGQDPHLDPHLEWSSDGAVVLTAGDMAFYEPKVTIYATRELCTVDLTSCPPAHPPVSQPACFCKSRTDDRYQIHMGSTTTPCEANMKLHAIVPGRGPLKNIAGMAQIGTLPNKTVTTKHVKARFTIDSRPPTDLLDTQTVSVCPNKRFYLEVCVQTNESNARMELSVGRHGANAVGEKCVGISHKVSSDQEKRMTFKYEEPKECTFLKYIDFKEDAKTCTPGKNHASDQQIMGKCPNTPRRIATLPGGTQALVDEVSMEKSWRIFQRRVSGAVNFYLPWDQYVEGFGNLTDSFWIGLRELECLCNEKHKCELLVDLQYPNKPKSKDINQTTDGCYYAHYSEFWLEPASKYYKLHVGGFSGTASDGLWHKDDRYSHDKMSFSTYDADHDTWSGGNCASLFKGAWWFAQGYRSNLNGIWGHNGSSKAMQWGDLTNRISVAFSEMKARRKT